MEFQGPTTQRVLLCTNELQRWAGSELVLIEFAEALVARGMSVEVFANVYDSTFVAPLIKKGVRVSDRPSDFRLVNYDLVYCQHQLVSLLVPQALKDLEGAHRFPAIVYNHLSPFNRYEAPGPFVEREIATTILCNSPETRDRLIEFDETYRRAELFQNPAPSAFRRTAVSSKAALASVLAVSNHMPRELRNALRIVAARGVRVTQIGRADEHRRVMPADIHGHDAVISIGKTVQYALAASKPVFCYDRFGGPGWLHEASFGPAAETNFSGRSAPRRLSARELADTLLSGFGGAARFAASLSEARLRPFLLDARLDDVICRAKNMAQDVPCQTDLRRKLASREFQGRAVHEAVFYELLRSEHRGRARNAARARRRLGFGALLKRTFRKRV